MEKEEKEEKKEEEETKCKSYITAPKGLFPCVLCVCCVSCSLVLRDMCDGACAPSDIMLSLSLD